MPVPYNRRTLGAATVGLDALASWIYTVGHFQRNLGDAMAVHGEPFPDSPSGADRKLGDEWEDWDGQTDSGDTSAPGRLFLILGGLAGLSFWVLGLFLSWLVYPRLSALGAGALGFGLAGLWTIYLGIWYTAVLLAWGTGARAFKFLARRLGGLAWIIGPAMIGGKWLGIGRDRVSHAYMLVHNQLELLPPPVSQPEKLLLLVPRCLNREVFQALGELKTRFGFTQMIVTGGTEARRAIGQMRPQGVIAVACERDLLSGVKDVKGRVPVLAFANRRPQGPCRNTVVDLQKVENGIKSFLGLSLTKEEKSS
jgi:hypothetical protein